MPSRPSMLGRDLHELDGVAVAVREDPGVTTAIMRRPGRCGWSRSGSNAGGGIEAVQDAGDEVRAGRRAPGAPPARSPGKRRGIVGAQQPGEQPMDAFGASPAGGVSEQGAGDGRRARLDVARAPPRGTRRPDGRARAARPRGRPGCRRPRASGRVPGRSARAPRRRPPLGRHGGSRHRARTSPARPSGDPGARPGPVPRGRGCGHARTATAQAARSAARRSVATSRRRAPYRRTSDAARDAQAARRPIERPSRGRIPRSRKSGRRRRPGSRSAGRRRRRSRSSSNPSGVVMFTADRDSSCATRRAPTARPVGPDRDEAVAGAGGDLDLVGRSPIIAGHRREPLPALSLSDLHIDTRLDCRVSIARDRRRRPRRGASPACARPARVVGGSGGLGRVVRAVNVMEVPDILDWVQGRRAPADHRLPAA